MTACYAIQHALLPNVRSWWRVLATPTPTFPPSQDPLYCSAVRQRIRRFFLDQFFPGCRRDPFFARHAFASFVVNRTFLKGALVFFIVKNSPVLHGDTIIVRAVRAIGQAVPLFFFPFHGRWVVSSVLSSAHLFWRCV